MSDSPFLPNTYVQFAWDSTSLGWLKTCPRLYQYSMVEGWRSKGSSVHLDFGGWYHSALEHYDKARALNVSHEEALRDIVHLCLQWTWIDGRPWISEDNYKTRETLIRTVIWYLDKFKDDPAQTIILQSGKPAVELSFRMELDWGPTSYIKHDEQICLEPGAINWAEGPLKPNNQPYILCGHLDRVVEFSGGQYVMDRKTTKTTPGPYYFDGYSPNNQMTLYTFAAKAAFLAPIRGVIIDAAQVAVGFSRFVRGFTYRTPNQLEEWLKDLRYWLRQAEVYATDQYWPMNDTSCDKFGGCVFRKVCSKDPEVRQTFLESDFEKRPWNPLEVR